MRYDVVTQVKVINGSTPEETAVLFNEAMHQLKGQNPTFERDGNLFWIFYTAGEYEAESLAEQYELRGEGRKCNACPYCMREQKADGTTDLRKKWAICASDGHRINLESSACDTYYEAMERRAKKGGLNDGNTK